MPEATNKFRAFISYSHSDGAAATSLYRRLEQYRIPKKLRRGNVARLGRFFLDKEELGAAAALGAELEEKLNEADRLIVCCSPAAAKSKWVNQEIDFFIRVRGRGAVLAVILAGEPHEAFPEILREDEPLAADFRSHRDGKEIGFLKLVAGLMGVDLGELRDLQAKMERAQARLRMLLVVLFGFLAVAAIVAASFAYRENLRAQAMTVEAIGIGAGIVSMSEEMSLRFGVPSSAVEEMLKFAEERFERLFARGVVGTELSRQQMALLVDFSRHFGRTGDVTRQRENAARALVLLQDLPPQEQRTIDFVEVHAALGDAEWALGNESAAIQQQLRAIDAARQMLRDIPDGQLARNRLAGALDRLGGIQMATGHPDRSLPIFTEAVTLLIYVLEQQPTDDLANANLVTGIDSLGSAEAMMGRIERAIATFDDAIARARAWLEVRPDSLATRAALGSVLMKRGQTLSNLGRIDEARDALNASVANARELLEADPRDAVAKRDVALRLGLLAGIEVNSGALDAAAPYAADSIVLWRELVAGDPQNVQLRDSFIKSLALAAAIASDRKDFALAQQLLAEKAENYRALRVDDAGSSRASLAEYAETLERLGDSSAGLRNVEATLAAYTEAATMRRRLAVSQPDDTRAKSDLAKILHALGLARKFSEDAAGAAEALMEAATLRHALSAGPGPGGDAALAFAAADSFQQLALVQAKIDGQAAKVSLESARDILLPLVQSHPDEPAYADSLSRTEGVLALFPKDSAPMQE